MGWTILLYFVIYWRRVMLHYCCCRRHWWLPDLFIVSRGCCDCCMCCDGCLSLLFHRLFRGWLLFCRCDWWFQSFCDTRWFPELLLFWWLLFWLLSIVDGTCLFRRLYSHLAPSWRWLPTCLIRIPILRVSSQGNGWLCCLQSPPQIVQVLVSDVILMPTEKNVLCMWCFLVFGWC